MEFSNGFRLLFPGIGNGNHIKRISSIQDLIQIDSTIFIFTKNNIVQVVMDTMGQFHIRSVQN